METRMKRRSLRSPEECVALLRYHSVGTAMAVVSFGIITVMMGLVWRVLAR